MHCRIWDWCIVGFVRQVYWLCEIGRSWFSWGIIPTTCIFSMLGNDTNGNTLCCFRADSRLAPSQWEMSLQSNAVSHWLGANLESALLFTQVNSAQPKMMRLELDFRMTDNNVKHWEKFTSASCGYLRFHAICIFMSTSHEIALRFMPKNTFISQHWFKKWVATLRQCLS